MSTYRYSLGHNIALGSLTVAAPQPRSGEIANADRVPGVSGKVFPRGFNVAVWLFGALTFEQYDTLLTGLGLSLAVASTEVTIYTKLNTATDGVQDFARFNALVIAPQHGGSDITRGVGKGWVDARFRFTLLEQLSEP